MKIVGAGWLLYIRLNDWLRAEVSEKKKNRRRTGDLHSNPGRPTAPATSVIHNSQAEQCFSAAALDLFVRTQRYQKICPSLFKKMIIKKRCRSSVWSYSRFFFFFANEIGLQACCSSSEPTAAPWEWPGSRAAAPFLQNLSSSLFVWFFFSPLVCKNRTCPHKVPKNHSNILRTSGEQSGGCVCVHASVGEHVAEGRSLAEYRLEEVEVLINACGEGRGGWKGVFITRISL